MLQDDGWCWIKFENCQIFVATVLDVARCCARLASSVTHLTTRSNNVARCYVKMLRSLGQALKTPFFPPGFYGVKLEQTIVLRFLGWELFCTVYSCYSRASCTLIRIDLENTSDFFRRVVGAMLPTSLVAH